MSQTTAKLTEAFKVTASYHGPKTDQRISRRTPNLAEGALSVRVVDIVPVRVVEMVPVWVVDIVPALVVEIVPVLVVEMVPLLAKVVADSVSTNIAVQTMTFTFFIFLAPG